MVAKEFESYINDITALSETQLLSYDGMVDHGHTIFLEWQGENERNESRHGFPIGNSIAEQLKEDPTPVGDRLVTIRLPLQRNVCHHSWVCMLQNGPTSERSRRNSTTAREKYCREFYF